MFTKIILSYNLLDYKYSSQLPSVFDLKKDPKIIRALDIKLVSSVVSNLTINCLSQEDQVLMIASSGHNLDYAEFQLGL
jgi:hypothetical protein